MVILSVPITLSLARQPIRIRECAVRYYDDNVEGIRQEIEMYKPQKLQFIPVPMVTEKDMHPNWAGSGSRYGFN